MQISILVYNLSSNPIVRAYPIAKVLQRNNDVEILGFVFEKRVFKPYEKEFNYKIIQSENFPVGVKRLTELSRMISGDVIYTFKPRLTTFGVGIASKLFNDKSLILDIEDFELAQHYSYPWIIRQMRFMKHFLLHSWLDPNAFPYEFFVDKMTGYADQKTVASNFLQQRYGGIKIPHGVDTTYFDPRKYNKNELRDKFGISKDTKVTLFAGTPKWHKGIAVLAQTIERLSKMNYKILLLVVGVDNNDPVTNKLLEKYKDVMICVERRPHSEMPMYLALADFVILPQKNTLYSQAQVPGKVFEAMAMGKPVIASGVSDLPEILDGCGLIYSPEDEIDLFNQVEKLCEDGILSAELGSKARRKCETLYSWDAMEEILLNDVFEKI